MKFPLAFHPGHTARLPLPSLSWILRVGAVSALVSHAVAAITSQSQQGPTNKSSAAPELDIRDIAPPVDAFPYPPWMIATVAALCGVVLGALIWLFIRWLRNRPAPTPPSPRATALKELEALRNDIQKREPYSFSIIGSEILRTFISAHFGLQAVQQTSSEFLAAAAQSDRFSQEDRALLARFMEKCDLIQFARIAATEEDNRSLLTSAIAFVQATRA
jgi:hypothetical protein